MRRLHGFANVLERLDEDIVDGMDPHACMSVIGRASINGFIRGICERGEDAVYQTPAFYAAEPHEVRRHA